VVAQAEELLELGVELELGAVLELGVELELGAELELSGTELEELMVLHTAPIMVGFSAAAPFLSPCTPKLMDWPG
jgi:hypothetical protein